MILDAHAHVWTIDPARYPWHPTFGFIPTSEATPEDLLAAMDRRGVTMALLVQPSAYGHDHRFLLDTVQAHPERFRPVGLVDPADERDAGRAVDLVRKQGCVGLRVNLALDLGTAASQARGPGWPRIAALGVPIALRATPEHQPLVVEILARHRDVPFVVDHLGLPAVGEVAGAIDRLAALAQHGHCWLKVCGLSSLSRERPPYRDTWPLVEVALRTFGPGRLVWGSDFPAGGVAEGYEGAVEAMESMPFLDPADRSMIMSATARKLWAIA